MVKQSNMLQDNLSLLPVLDLSTPVDALHAYVIRALQTQGLCAFPLPKSAPRRDWISEETWKHMALLAPWRKQRVRMRDWSNKLLLNILCFSKVVAVIFNWSPIENCSMDNFIK